MRVTNNTPSPVDLEDGTIVGAVHTETATREVKTLSAGDRRRYVERKDPIITILDEGQVTTPSDESLDSSIDRAGRRNRPTS